ncbi:PH domain-containing protein [Marinicella sp. W31]|uniref:PH domain-containing protein n=1 Tax=Marinicella sp. W31 TaxID=3023713 RepID=UPI003757327B
MRTFKAPWAISLKLITLLVSLLLIAIPIVGVLKGIASDSLAHFAIAFVPLVILIGAALFTVFSYEIHNNQLWIRRLLWHTKLDLSDLNEAFADPNIMKSSWRIFGNGGLFSFTGTFKNKKLGFYRAYATNPKTAVVLKFGSEKTVVVTPDQPQSMVNALNTISKNFT